MAIEDIQYLVFGFGLYIIFYWQSRGIAILKEFLK